MVAPEISRPLKQPYVERQFIVVADDALVQESRKAASNALGQGASVDWSRVAEIALKAALGMPGDLIATAAREAHAAWMRARTAGVDAVQISKTEARSLTFPPGHPRDGVLYVGHPALANTYYTMAEFHRVVFEHKFAEAIRLLAWLGATRIDVRHVRGWSRDVLGSAGGEAADGGVTASVEGGLGRKTSASLLFSAKLQGTDDPQVPTDLCWYSHEPIWQVIADARIRFGLTDFQLSVTYQDDYGVNAALKAKVMEAGLSAGGKFDEHVSTEWHLTGTFCERTRLGGGS